MTASKPQPALATPLPSIGETSGKKPRKRPFGITVLIALQLLLTIGILAEVYTARFTGVGVLVPDDMTVMDIILTIRNWSQLLTLITIIGLWFLKRWAWVLMMLHVGIALTVLLLLYAQGTPLYVRMFILVVSAFYLNQRDVRFAFQHPRRELESL